MSFVLTNKKINKVALSGDDDKRIILEDILSLLDISNRRMIAFLDQRLQNEIGVFHFFCEFYPSVSEPTFLYYLLGPSLDFVCV